jgi:hypothetical protein
LFHNQNVHTLAHRLRGVIPEIASRDTDDELLPFAFSQQLREPREVASSPQEDGDGQQAEIVMNIAKRCS